MEPEMPAIGTHILVSLCYHVESEKKKWHRQYYLQSRREIQM